MLVSHTERPIITSTDCSQSDSVQYDELGQYVYGMLNYYQYFYVLFKMNDYETTKLKKELQRKQQLLKEEREDHKQTKDILVGIQAERDRFYSELIINRQTIEKVNLIMADKIKEIKLKLEQENSASLNQLQNLRDKLVEQKLVRQRLNEETKTKDAIISNLSERLKQLSRKYKDPSLLANTKEIGEQAAVSHNALYRLTEKYNKVCADLQNIMAENKILRKLHGVPEEFGFDLEEIKIAEKQELEDYKAQCRRLQAEVEELQQERTQLRYRLRQYSALFSNKGERYKDLSNQQLERLDQYAMDLKEGRVELPQMDKTQKQMERQIIKLRAQIQILQNRPIPQAAQQKPQPQPQEGAGSDRLSVQALKKLEDQFIKLINPLRDDLKKITEVGVRVQDGNRQESDSKNSFVREGGEGPQFRPPMPLPIAHNDWTHINEGFSYMYNSKIPISLKDVSDENSFNIAKAKYEVAALQLQNIESLKLLKEKQGIENKLTRQVQQLKEKYEKCVRVQDQLFLRYFREKQVGNERVKKLQVQRNALQNQKTQLQANLTTLTSSFNALTKKTDLQKRCSELTSRLAILEAELFKLNRKYSVLNEQHRVLRSSYTNLQSKSAASEYGLREKLAYAKKSQKQLTFYLRKVLADCQDSVGGDVHRALLSRVQMLSDRGVGSSIRQTELRVRINQLENIERQINLKDEIIETLRDDNFDLILEMEIVKNRLESTDSDYRQFQDIFRRLIAFINQNNISLSTYFRKFDRDGSGQLGKNEFISAIKAIGFDISNNEFELLFAEFDLDGSQSITYREFLRKMRRSGVMTRNSEEEALFRLFKAIKQANISVRKAFQIIDMDGSNEVSKVEMETAFRKIGIDITMTTIDYIFKLTDSDMTGTISCNQFEKLFEDIIRESAIEEKEVFGGEMDWKLLFVLKMEEISEKYHKGGLKQTFNSFDADKSGCLTLNQLTDFFKKAGIDIQRKDLLELFEFLDRHRDGKIEYIQFLKVLEEAKQEKKRSDRMKYIKARTEELRKQNQLAAGSAAMSKGPSEEKALNVKLLSLETKHSSLIKKNEKLIKLVANREQEALEAKKEIEQLEKNLQQVRTEYYKQKEGNIRLEEKTRNRISEEQSKKLSAQAKLQEVETQQLRNNLELYKKLYEDLSTRNRYEEMRVVKIESEVEKYYQIVKDLQGLSDLNAELGKKVYELEVSKRNEEIIGKKFEQSEEETRVMQGENLKLSEESLEKEREIINTHFFFQQKSQLMQRTIDELNSKILPTLSPKRIEDILLKIRDISNSKTELEKENREIRELNFNLQVRNDYIQNEKTHLNQLQKKLRRTYTDESSITIIDMTKKLSEYKMGELKAKRETGLLKEKEEYYLRINNTQTENIKQIQQELANWEKKYNQREEFWRKRLADQIKLMEDLQKEAAKTKTQERNAERFFQEQGRQERITQQKFDALPQQKQSKLSQMIRRKDPGNENAVFQLKAKVQQLQEELMSKERELYQFKSTFKEIVPEARLADFAGQMSASTTNILLQTDMTTSQLRSNARRFINNQKDQEQYYREEAQKISQAAQQSVDTLQRMIDDKNEQLKRKEQLIDSLKREFMRSKEDDCRQIQLLNEQIRELKTRVQTASLNEIMSRPTSKNFYPSSKSEELLELRNQLQRKEEDYRLLQEKYDKLFISKEKKNQDVAAGSQRQLERKLDELQEERQAEKKRYLENEQRLNLKIRNLQKLSKEKDGKLAKLQNTLLDLKNLAVNEAVKGDGVDMEGQMREALETMNKGKTANDAKMEITMQKALQTVQELTKKNKQYEQELRRLKEEKFAKTSFRK